MTKDEEIQAAMVAVVGAARMVDAHTMKGSPNYGLQDAILRLDALQSPLPSREEMSLQWKEAWNSTDANGEVVAQIWSTCLRWVTDLPSEMRHLPHMEGFIAELKRRSK